MRNLICLLFLFISFMLSGCAPEVLRGQLTERIDLNERILYRSTPSSAWQHISQIPRSLNLTGKTQHYWLKVTIKPSEVKKYRTLYFESINEVISVSTNKKKILQIGDISSKNHLRLQGTAWYQVSLPSDEKPQELVFEVFSYHHLVSLANAMALSNEKDIYLWQIKNGYPSFFLGGILISFAVYILLVFYHPNLRSQYSSLCLFVLSWGMITIAYSPFSQLIYNAPAFWQSLLMIFFPLLPFSISIFTYTIFEFPLRQWFKKLLIFQTILQILFSGAILTLGWTVGHFMLFCLAILTLDAIFIVWGNLYCAFQKKRSAYLFLIGFFIYIASVLHSAALVILKTPVMVDSFSRGGAFVFCITLVLILREQVKETYQSQEVAIQANQQKNIFLANMSHELRTPLNAIIGFSRVLLKNKQQSLSVKELTYLTRIESNGKHLLNLVESILDISKIEAGEMEAHLESISLQSILNRILNTVSPLIEKQNNRFEIINTLSSNFVFQSDPERLYQILLNLISNASKFTESGSIELEITRVDQELRFSVKDNGVGIKENDLNTLFKAFSQVDQGYAKRDEGTGLGLTISQRFAELLDGRINVESKYEKGSIFTLTLPF